MILGVSHDYKYTDCGRMHKEAIQDIVVQNIVVKDSSVLKKRRMTAVDIFTLFKEAGKKSNSCCF